MICRHDWYNHCSTDKSFQFELICDGGDNPAPIIIAIVVGGLWAVAAGLTFFPFCGAILVGLNVGIMSMVWMAYHEINEIDPWAVSDRTCIKCGKVQFNCTKREEKMIAKYEKDQIEANLRRKLCSIAQENFDRKSKLRRKAKA